MAIVKGPIQLSGSLSNISFYTRRGSDQIIARTKGGASGDKIKKLPQYEGMRLQQKEWSGVTKLASAVRYTFGGLHRLADYNLTSVLNGLVNKMQKADTTSEKGKRPVRLSLFRQALSGFNFNRNYPFNSVLRVSLNAELNREMLSASVVFPRINTDIDLLNVQRLPFFRLIVAVGTASDMMFNENMKDYLPVVEGLQGTSVVTTGEWHSANTIVDEHTLTAQMSEAQIARLTDDVTVLLSVAVEFGMVGFTGAPQEVKYAGSGKVLKVV
jgi:hypothetical protein